MNPRGDFPSEKRDRGRPGAGRIEDLLAQIDAMPSARKKVEALRETIRLFARASKPYRLDVPSDGNTLRFGLIGDPHFGSLYEDLDALTAFYAEAKRQGVQLVLVAGDVLDGHGMYAGQEFEVHKHGFSEQAEWFAQRAPRADGVQTKFVTGNHDGSFKKRAGARVGTTLQEARPDWTCLGEDYAVVDLPIGKQTVRVRLEHPGGGTAYAVSYRPQKITEALEGGSKPDLLAIGHYHKAELLPSYRNVCVIQVGTFQRQTPFMASKAIAAHVGGWIVSVTIWKRAKRFEAQFLSFFGGD